MRLGNDGSDCGIAGRVGSGIDRPMHGMAAGIACGEIRWQRRYITAIWFYRSRLRRQSDRGGADAGGLSTAQRQAIASEFNYPKRLRVAAAAMARTMPRSAVLREQRDSVSGPTEVGTAVVHGRGTARKTCRARFLSGKRGLGPVDILNKTQPSALNHRPSSLKKLTSFKRRRCGGRRFAGKRPK